MSDFFERLEDYQIRANFYECDQCFTVEELYQEFKARLMLDLYDEIGEKLAERNES